MRKFSIHDNDRPRVTRKRVRRGASLTIALGGAVALAATGAPASAADFPTVPIQGVHHCEVIGSADGYQAWPPCITRRAAARRR
jgi:hypothetical protein